MKNDVAEHPPRPYRFTRKDYYAMGDAGLFENQRVELIDGEILLMSPQKGPHAASAGRLTEMFVKQAPDGIIVRCQLPLKLGGRTEPEPDIAIVKGSWDEFIESHPKTAELVIEIANASVNYDRKNKGSLYAKAQIPEFWLINLIDKCVEVFRKPVKAKDQIFGYKYSSCQILRSGETISPLFLPGMKITVKELLP